MSQFVYRQFARLIVLRHGLCAAVVLLGLTATAATLPPGTQLAQRQELVRNNGAEPESLDAALAETVPANNITRDLFEALTAVNNLGEIVPGVAESWRQTSPTTWVFKLRHNARWSNGEPVTAEDFVFGWRRFLDPKTASTYAATFGVFILNGIEISQGKKPVTELGIKASDRYTLEVQTPFPVSFLPDVLSNGQFGPVHKASLDAAGKEWTRPGKLVGNGAYVLKEWQVNNKIVLEKNTRYWDAKAVPITRVSYLAVEDPNADVKLFQSGENDWVEVLPPGSFEKMKAAYPKEIHNSPWLGLRYYSLLNTDPLLKDVRVRKALSMVIDRKILADKVTADAQVPAYGVVVKGVKGAGVTAYDWADWPMDKRVAEARQLLAAVGVKAGTSIRFAYNTNDYHKKMAIFVASEWKTKLGLNTLMENMEFKVLLKRRHDGDYQVARNGWIADYNDATTFLTLVQCNSDQNDNRNCNPKAEALIQQGNESPDTDKRKSLLTEAARLVMEDYPLIPLLQYTKPRLVRATVGGYTDNNALDRFRTKELFIKKP